MSTKTIALEASVYEKLAALKRPSESFTKVINRLTDSSVDTTCAGAVAMASKVWQQIGDEEEAELMDKLRDQGRMMTDWSVEVAE